MTDHTAPIDPIAEMQQRLALQYDLTARAFHEPDFAHARTTATPQPTYAEYASRCPVRDLGDGMYSLLTKDDISFVARHHDVQQLAKYLGSDRPAIPLGMDGAEHKKYRHLIDPVFTPKRVNPLAGNVRRLANELIDGFVDQGSADVYRSWCEPLPSIIFLSIMGLPTEDLDAFLHFKNLTLGGDPEAAQLSNEERLARRAEAVTWIQEYFTQDLDARAKEPTPRDDIIAHLLASEVDGDKLTREEVLDILGLLMIAGLDTVAAALSCMLSYLARHPDDRQRLAADPSLARTAIEELMRFESPVTDGFREAHGDLPLPSGTIIPKGSYMHLSWAAANLDPTAFDDPLSVDLAREPNSHIGFASGFHRCLGSHLARMELQTALVAWHERIPEYAIEPGTELVYSGNPRAPHRLPLVW
jgi:cytochrome P450